MIGASAALALEALVGVFRSEPAPQVLRERGEAEDVGSGGNEGEIAAAAGVVRRTVYGHFPNRGDLVRTLAQQAADEVEGALAASSAAAGDADAVWADFVRRLWPVAHHYRVLLALRRSEHGEEIHSALGGVDEALRALVARGQAAELFGRHLPAVTLGQLASATVFTIADRHRTQETFDVRAAIITSLLLLGVPQPRALALAA
jgi:AcrR family transcriptional regulator